MIEIKFDNTDAEGFRDSVVQSWYALASKKMITGN